MANCTGIMLIAGFTGGMDTECAQAMGAKRFHILGEVFQRALLVTSIPALFISIFWWNLELVLVSAGISRDISAEAGRYIRAFIPALWIIVVWACARRFLTTQRLTKPMLYGTLTGLCLCPLFNWLLIDRAGLKVIGAAFAADINWLVMLSATGLTILGMASMGRLSEHPTTWTGFSPQAFKHWGAFLRLAIPSCVTVVLGILAYEVVVLFSGLTKTTRGHHVDVSAFSLNFNLAMIIYAIPVSASFATAARVGAHLGAGKPENAKLVTGMGFLAVASYLFVTFTIAVFSPLRQGWSRLFADGDEHIVDLSSDLMPLAMTLTIPNNLKQILTGSLRGAGKQSLEVRVVCISYLIVALPISAALGFEWHQQWLPGLKGLYFGLIVGATMHLIGNAYILSRIDWKAVSDAAVGRCTRNAQQGEQKMEVPTEGTEQSGSSSNNQGSNRV
eukprot:gene3812-4765_t